MLTRFWRLHTKVTSSNLPFVYFYFVFAEVTSGLSTAGSSCQRELLVVNYDLESGCVDVELRAALQWIAASELGVPALFFNKSQEHNLMKVRARGKH